MSVPVDAVEVCAVLGAFSRLQITTRTDRQNIAEQQQQALPAPPPAPRSPPHDLPATPPRKDLPVTAFAFPAPIYDDDDGEPQDQPRRVTRAKVRDEEKAQLRALADEVRAAEAHLEDLRQQHAASVRQFASRGVSYAELGRLIGCSPQNVGFVTGRYRRVQPRR